MFNTMSKRVRIRHRASAKIAKARERDYLKENLLKYKTTYFLSCRDIRNRLMAQIANMDLWKDSEIHIKPIVKFRSMLHSLVGMKSSLPDLKNMIALSKGQRRVLFTNVPYHEIERRINSFSVWDYPQRGYEVRTTITLKRGPLPKFYPVMEPYLRKLGLPTAVENGKVVLLETYEVCRSGDTLTYEQVHLLELLGEKISVYTMKLRGKWSRDGGFVSLKTEEDSESDGDEMECSSE